MLQPYNFFLIIAQKDKIPKGKAQLPVSQELRLKHCYSGIKFNS